jgi:DNA-directed RNA polymerase beta' subunit
MDDVYLRIKDPKEKNIYLANTIKKFQKSINDIYQFAQEKQLGEKESILRSSILGKTVEFSGRSVVTCGPNLPPYMLSVPRDAAKKIFLLEALHHIIEHEPDIVDINDIASFMQLVTHGIENANINIDDETFDRIFEKIRPHLRVMFERPPTLFMYNDSTWILDELFENKFQIKE